MSFYDYLNQRDLYSKLKPAIDAGVLKPRPDGKLEIQKGSLSLNTPWIHTNLKDNDKDCFINDDILFKCIIKSFPKEIMSPPLQCHRCVKIAVRLERLIDAFKSLSVQRKLNYPSKTGAEVREWVGGNFGAYWYCNNFDEAFKKAREIKAEFKRKKIKKYDLVVKRGCTEMELHFGDSRLWAPTDFQERIEKWVLDNLVYENTTAGPMPKNLQVHVMREWVEFGYQRGLMDREAKQKLLGGKPFLPPYTRYEHLDGASQEQITEFLGASKTPERRSNGQYL